MSLKDDERRLIDDAQAWRLTLGPLCAVATVLRHVPTASGDLKSYCEWMAVEHQRYDALLRRRLGERWWEELATEPDSSAQR